MSQTAIDQRSKNGQRKRQSANLKALNERLSLKVDEFRLMNEIMGYIEQTFSPHATNLRRTGKSRTLPAPHHGAHMHAQPVTGKSRTMPSPHHGTHMHAQL